MQPIYRYRTGFTLIELLTVIAIIAVLAALLFPVFGRVRESARQSQCFTNMHDIYRAVKLYKEDNNKYPSALLGYVQYIDNNNNTQFYTGTGRPLLPAGLAYRPLFNGQKYLRDTALFACPDEKIKDPSVVTTAIYPSGKDVGPAGQTVAFTPLIQHNTGNDANTGFPNGQNAYFYAYDSYDLGPQLDFTGKPVQSNGQSVLELHYSLDWTGGSGPTDLKNQMKYPVTAPEDSTVLTWCSDHVAYANTDKVLVLTLSGSAKPVDAGKFARGGPLHGLE